MGAIGVGRGLWALAAASLGILGLVYPETAPFGPSLPAHMAWQPLWVYGPAILVLAAGVGVCFRRTALPGTWAIGAYLLLWAASSVPSVLSDPLSVDAWYGLCEALTSLAGAGLLYGVLRARAPESQRPLAGPRAARAARAAHAARVLFGLTCIFYGCSHFAYAAYTAGMVPGWLPDRPAVADFTGAAHIAAGLGIAVGILPRLAATLEATMMSLFGLLVWVPSFFARPRPAWATPPQNQWSELVVTLVLLSSAWIVAISLRDRSWVFGSGSGRAAAAGRRHARPNSGAG